MHGCSRGVLLLRVDEGRLRAKHRLLLSNGSWGWANCLRSHTRASSAPALVPSHSKMSPATAMDNATCLHRTLPCSQQPLSIYIHIPFCIQKCGYCDFNAYLYRHDTAQAYLSALRREIMHTATERPWIGYRVSSVYFGGGTPSTLAAADLTSLLSLIRGSFPVQ